MRFLVSLGIMGILAVSPVSAQDFSSILKDLGSRDPQVVSAAVEKLGERGDDVAVMALIRVIEAPVEDWKIQIRAINLLAEIGNPLAVDILINVMNDPFLTNECPALKWNAVRALGRFGDEKRVVSALIYRLDDRDLYVKEAVIQSMGESGNPELVPVIAPFLRDRSFAIRLSAVKALGRIDGPSALSFIEAVAREEKDQLIRHEASKLLKSLKTRLSSAGLFFLRQS
ncbi:MAG: HEAT repeat domain-containing protein [Thermodesulfovibrionales bacterium]